MSGALLVPAVLPYQAFCDRSDLRTSSTEFHLHPHYPTKMPLDTTLLKVPLGSDEFVSEKYAGQLSRVLEKWRTRLLESAADLASLETTLGEEFLGSSCLPRSSEPFRSGPIESSRATFPAECSLRREGFLRDFRSSMNSFANLLTVEFHVTAIELVSEAGTSEPRKINTRVRYELVGTGRGFYREQRVGDWELEWDVTSSPNAELRVRTWKMLGETRTRSLAPVFADVTSSAFAGCLSYSAQLLHGSDYWRTVLDGACGIDVYGHNGVSVGDIDNDGFDELYVCQPAGLPNRLYRSRGDGTFEDITEMAGVGVLENTPCALFADIDNDGRQDLIVVRTDGPLLFVNQGGGRFQQKPEAFKFANTPQGAFAGAAIADYDRDGWLDIYFCLYIYYQGAGQYKYPIPYYAAENGPPNFLMRNNRDRTFTDVTSASGLDQHNTRYSFCCGWNDYNRDGWPDLYVVNDFGRKNLYLNHGNGTFSDVAAEMGVEDVGAGMSLCWLDYDNDGRQDLYVADMWTAAGERVSMQAMFQKDAPPDIRRLYQKHAMGNSLFLNGGTHFEDRTRPAGLGMGRWAWSSDAWDFDHDGFLDLYVTNGMISGRSGEDLNSFFWRQVVANSPSQAKASYDYEQGWNAINELIRSDGTWSGYERNVFYANNGNGTFSDVSGVVGMDFLEDGRSFALSDFNHDGRLEVVLKNRNAPQLRLLSNVLPDLPPAIAFRLQGTKSNRDAIGATVTVESNSGRQTRTLQAGSGFLSQHSKELFFGLGNEKGPVRASVRWPSGLTQELEGLPSNHRISIEEGSSAWRKEPFEAVISPRDGQRRPAGRASELRKSALVDLEPLPATVETWLLVPVEAPDFSLRDLSERPISLAGRRGKAVLLNFFTADSAVCQQDLKTFGQAYKHWATAGIEVLAVKVDEPREQQNFRAWAAKRGLSFPILRATDETAGVYNILYRYLFDRHRDLSLPTSFLINPAGEIVKLYQGPIDQARVELDSRRMPASEAERVAQALPFAGLAEAVEFRRNYLSYGSIFFQRGYLRQARASFERAVRDNPSSAEASYGLGSVFLAQQENQQARDCFERVTKLQVSYPDTLPNTWNNLGLIATREGRTADAIANFEEALRFSPDYLIALTNLGNVYRQQRQWEKARDILDRAVSIGPQDPDANYSLGMVYAQLNDSEHAYQYLERALQFRPVYPEALNNLGILYVRTQRLDDATQMFERSIRVAPQFDQSYLNLARVYVLEGTPDKARSVLLELLKRRPDQADAQKMLDQLGR